MKPLRVFFSYSRKDGRYLEELRRHAAVLVRQGILAPWSDDDIPPGSDFEQDIWTAMNQADLVVVLLSADSLASEWCHREVKTALELRSQGKLRVVPVLLRSCDWQNSPIAKLSILPRNGEPVSRWTSRDEAWSGIVGELGKLATSRSQ